MIFTLDLFVELFFFFKQKTAYEMRISDWSSDVCSSDLRDARATPRLFDGIRRAQRQLRARERRRLAQRLRWRPGRRGPAGPACERQGCRGLRPVAVRTERASLPPAQRGRVRVRAARRQHLGLSVGRSEEHTSELQSLMRTSYAVFCLKKKKT